MRLVVFGNELQRFVEQVFLAVEMQVDDALRKAGFLRDITERGTADAFASYAFHRRINELLPPFFLCCSAARAFACDYGHL
ncbi:hypothetical protein D3C83_89890 [compost metagenome]